MGMFMEKMKYKASWTNTVLHKNDMFQASTTICHNCGYKLDKPLDTKYRSWTCPHCGSFLDRDTNAAIVIDMIGEDTLPTLAI